MATVPGSGVVELIEVKPRGAPGPGQVRLKIERVGVCGTDRKVAHGWAGARNGSETGAPTGGR